MLGLEHGLYEIWYIHQSKLVEILHMIFNETLFSSRSVYRKFTCHADKANKPSIDIDMEQLPDVESSQTENNQVFEEGTGRDTNSSAVDENDGKEEKDPKYPQKESTTPQIGKPIPPGKARTLTAQVLKRSCSQSAKMSRNKKLINSRKV